MCRSYWNLSEAFIFSALVSLHFTIMNHGSLITGRLLWRLLSTVLAARCDSSMLVHARVTTTLRRYGQSEVATQNTRNPLEPAESEPKGSFFGTGLRREGQYPQGTCV